MPKHQDELNKIRAKERRPAKPCQSEASQQQTALPWLNRMPERDRAQEEQLIAKLHCETVYRGLHLPHQAVQRQAAAQWLQWAEEYPMIYKYCLEQAKAYGRLGQRP